MHQMLTIVIDLRGVHQSVCHAAQLTQLHCVGVIQCSLCQITLASGYYKHQFLCQLLQAGKIVKMLAYTDW